MDGRSRLAAVFIKALEQEPSAFREDWTPETVRTWDSVRHLQLVTAVETEFGIYLTNEELLAFEGFRAAEEILRKRGVL